MNAWHGLAGLGVGVLVVTSPLFGPVLGGDAAVRVVFGWGKRRVGTPFEHLHQGLDIPAVVGTPIHPAAMGRVVVAHEADDNDGGIHVAVDHGNGLITRYLHCSELSVTEGQLVGVGTELARSGNTGRSDAPHLHFDTLASDALLARLRTLLKVSGAKVALGTLIPSEPFLPAQYSASVVATARTQRIPLHDSIPAGALRALARI